MLAIKRGPFQVTGTHSNWVYHVRNLVTGKEQDVHSCLLEFYEDASLNVTAELKEQLRYQQATFDVSRFLDVRYDRADKEWKLLVRWHGFGPADDSWESLELMAEDVPEMVRRFTSSRVRLSAAAKRAIEQALED